MPLLSEIRFGSYLVYSPSGHSAKSKKSVVVCHAVKNDAAIALESEGGRMARVIPHVIKHLALHVNQGGLGELFATRPVLVPAPRSSLVKPGTLWPPRLICDELVSHGLGTEVQELLQRIKAVPKAAVQSAAERPTASQHFDSMRAIPVLHAPASILLVDDVVTSGTMLVASISRLQEVYPQAAISAFALVRTMSGMEIDALLAPCVGTVHLNKDRGRRRP